MAPDPHPVAVARPVLEERYPLLTTVAAPLTRAARDVVGREKEKLQLLAALSRPELCNGLLLGPPGSGKLLPLETPIPTPSGWTTMGELQPGHEVLGRDGKPTKVSYVSEVDETPVLYDITLSDGQVITACADHQWLVSSHDGRGRTHPSSVAETHARRERVQARRDALLALADVDVPEFSTVSELIDLIGDVDGVTWHKPTGLHTYLVKRGVERRRVGHRGEQAWKGRTRVTTVYKDEFNTRIALKALSERAFRRTSWTDDGSAAESVLTTQQMVDAGVVVDSGRRQFSIRVTGPLDLPEANLPVDPYVLGAWLGDGSTAKGSFTQSDAIVDANGLSDMQHLIEQIEAGGYEAYSAAREPNAVGARRLEVALRAAGVLGDKHIPSLYLRGSIDQRLAVLQGLMDTDGTIDERGGCELTLSDAVLARGAEELIRSIGIKVHRVEGSAGYRDPGGRLVACKTRHRMVFTTTQPVFRLPRKASRIPGTTRPTQNWLYITDISVAPTRPGRCIQVDNDEHMYLAGEGFVPTHNTTLVQATMLADPDRLYLEVDPARMLAHAGTPEAMASMLKSFFDEAERYVADEGQQLVLFIDEFHQIVQLSAAAVEAIKPVLAASGARGIRIIAATTFDEFHQHVRPNQALVERLQRINLSAPDQKTTIEILRGMAERYGVGHEFYDDHLFTLIYDYTERFMPASVQPRKSILVLDSMVGWHKVTGRPMDRALLADVLYESLGVNVAFRVDGAGIKRELDQRVFSQDLATTAVAQRLQLSVADLNDPTRPEASLLFTGSSGVGKATTCATDIPVWHADGSVAWKKAGDVILGDYTFTRRGTPQKVLGVFPQGEREVYRVTLADGRHLDVSDNHLWAVYPNRRSRTDGPTIYSTQTLLNKGVTSIGPNGVSRMKYSIPMNQAVQWPHRDVPVDPYVIGALIGNGCLTVAALEFSSDDEHTVNKVGQLIGAASWEKHGPYSWNFTTGEPWGSRRKRIQTADLLRDVPELIGVRSGAKRIPDPYLCGSIYQRWALVHGLFDTDGSIGQADGDRFNVSYSTTSEGLTRDVQRLLFSLGVASTVGVSERDRDGRVEREHIVRVESHNDGKHRFFTLPRKLEIAQRAQGVNKHREKRFDYVGIRSIERLGHREPMVCLYVDDDEHLYQAGDYVVTHNTQLTKELARLLFGDDQQHLLRFDMSEYAEDTALGMFRSELTKRVWSTSHAVLLFDEIEKASPLAIRVLLQVLDDGRLSDDNGRVVSFLNTYIVLTTNAGSEVFRTIAQYAADDTGSGDQLKHYEKLIRRSIQSTTGSNRFPPELLGRIDAIVPFQPLSLETQRQIVRGKLGQLVQDVATKHGVRLDIDKKVLQYLVDDRGDTDSDAGGARTAVAKLAADVSTAVAAFLNEHPAERWIRADVVGGLVSDDKRVLTSTAGVEISAWR